MGRRRSAAEGHSRPSISSPFTSFGGSQSIGGFWIRNLELGSRNFLNFAALYSAKKFLEKFREKREWKIEELGPDDFEVKCCQAEAGDYVTIIEDKVVISWASGQYKMRDLDTYKYKPLEAEWELPDPYPNHIKRMMGEARSNEFKPVIKKERVSRDGLISIADICDELQIDPREARAHLRKLNEKKPDAGWAWDEKEAERVKKLLKKLAA